MKNWDWEHFWIAVCVLAVLSFLAIWIIVGYGYAHKRAADEQRTIRACLLHHEPIQCYRLVNKG